MVYERWAKWTGPVVCERWATWTGPGVYERWAKWTGPVEVQALELLEKVLTKFPAPLVDARFAFFFLPLAARLAGEPSQACRRAVATALSALLRRVTADSRSAAAQWCRKWLAAGDARLRVAGAQVRPPRARLHAFFAVDVAAAGPDESHAVHAHVGMGQGGNCVRSLLAAPRLRCGQRVLFPPRRGEGRGSARKPWHVSWEARSCLGCSPQVCGVALHMHLVHAYMRGYTCIPPSILPRPRRRPRHAMECVRSEHSVSRAAPHDTYTLPLCRLDSCTGGAHQRELDHIRQSRHTPHGAHASPHRVLRAAASAAPPVHACYTAQSPTPRITRQLPQVEPAPLLTSLLCRCAA